MSVDDVDVRFRAHRIDRGVPSKAALEAAMLAFDACEASDLHEYAVGHMLAAELRAAGLSTRQILEAYGSLGDDLALSPEHVVDLVLGDATLGDWARATLDLSPEPDAALVHGAALALARDPNAWDPKLLARVDAVAPARVRDVVLRASSQGERDAWLKAQLAFEADDIESQWIALEELLPSLHLDYGADAIAVLDATVARCNEAIGPEFRQTAFLVRGARMGKVYAPKRPTDDVRDARTELEEEYEPRRRIQRLPAIARAAAKKTASLQGLGKGFEVKGTTVNHVPTKATFVVHGGFMIATKPLSETAIAKLGNNENPGGHRPAMVDLPDLIDALEKGPFRLPTEAEWEVAKKPEGDELLPELLADPWDPKQPDGPRLVRRGAERMSQEQLDAFAFRPVLTLR